jgi:ankyrin repeat protein
MTPLYIACVKNHEEIVDLLLTYPDINIDIPDENGIKPLEIAEKNNYSKIN